MKVPEIIFDAVENTYTRKDTGAQVPEISRLLQDQGLYDMTTMTAEALYTRQTVHDIIKLGRARYRNDRHWLSCFRSFCSKTGFMVERQDVLLYNDQLNYACHVPLIGRFDYSGTIKAAYPAIVEILLPEEPNAAGILLAAYKMAATRNMMASSSTLCGQARLKGGYEYEYQDMTAPAFEEALKAIVERAGITAPAATETVAAPAPKASRTRKEVTK